MSKTTFYRRGYVLEEFVMKQLEKEGYYTIRSAGSHRLCDVIAIPRASTEYEKPLCIQCKKTSKLNQLPRISKKEIEELRQFEKDFNVKVMLAIRFRFKGRWITKILTIDEFFKLKNDIKMNRDILLGDE